MKHHNLEAKAYMERRRFLKILTAGATFGIPMGWGCSSDSDIVTPDPDIDGSLSLTPQQAEGPFYPVPSIEQQMFNDTDLTRKLAADSLARGQMIVIEGTVMDREARPLANSVVEIWQASDEGLYNHPQDAADNPSLDQNFQFWGRSITGEDGMYSFTTIVPGEYTGRAARHIHVRVDSPGFIRLSTQSYFSLFGSRNVLDSLYSGLSTEARNLLTVEYDQLENEPWRGTFNIVMAEL